MHNNNLENEFVPYQQSLELKELGFDEPCFGRFNPDGDLVVAHTGKYVISNGVDRREFFTLAPLFSQAFRFFREKGYETKVQKESLELYFGYYWTGAAWIIGGTGSYEEAELACLRKLIEIVKEKK
jgi:hypothetical protein